MQRASCLAEHIPKILRIDRFTIVSQPPVPAADPMTPT
jgi:hypothetical protein